MAQLAEIRYLMLLVPLLQLDELLHLVEAVVVVLTL
jgi:hypothetical protein